LNEGKRIPAVVYDTANVDEALDREGLRQIADAAENVNNQPTAYIVEREAQWRAENIL
jgi:hypothetical protein